MIFASIISQMSLGSLLVLILMGLSMHFGFRSFKKPDAAIVSALLSTAAAFIKECFESSSSQTQPGYSAAPANISEAKVQPAIGLLPSSPSHVAESPELLENRYVDEKPKLERARIVSQVEYAQERAFETIPSDGRIWKTQYAKCLLKEYSGVEVEFIAYRVFLEDSSGELFVKREYGLSPVKLKANESTSLLIKYPTTLLDLCSENWRSGDRMVQVKYMHTVLVGKDTSGNEVLVDIESGDTISHKPKKFLEKYTVF